VISELSSILADEDLAVIGGVGGDEGKGKIVAALAHLFRAVVRFGGASNAGHTTYTEAGQKLVGHLIPSGLAAGVPCVLGRGVLFDAARFVSERNEALAILSDKSPPTILVDRGCTLWTPYHSLFEMWCEEIRGAGRIGTTGRGVGPLAAIRDLRVDLKVEDLALSAAELESRVELLFQTLEPMLCELQHRRSRREQQYQVEVPRPWDVATKLAAVAGEVLPHVADTRTFLYDIGQEGGRILFEGSQAMMLDLMWGTYPFVSSSMSSVLGVGQGSGLPFKGSVCLVTKVMPTRVGVGGPMPSEFWDRALAEEFPKTHPEFFADGEARNQELGRLRTILNSGNGSGQDWACYFQILGWELGASTGRGRSVGALDLPWLAYAIAVNAPKFLALTRLDMLAGLEKVPVVVGYKLDEVAMPLGQVPTTKDLYRVEPVREWWPGFREDIVGVRREDHLPMQARDMLARIEAYLKVPIRLVGTGQGPHDLIVR
jgi:adenylosuccinate synthase